MKLKDLITDSNLALYKRVSNHLPVQLRKSDDDTWRSDKDEKRILIYYSSKSNYPQACFTHELLHIDLQLNGYKRLRSGVSLNNGVHQQLPFLCSLIDSEFQHHKMYTEFIEMGYHSNEFYHETDSLMVQYIQNGIAAKGQSLTSITNVYLTLIASGSPIAYHRIQEFKEQFQNYDEGAFRDRFDRIDTIIADWKSHTSYNAEPYIINLLEVSGCADTWIAYEFDASDFPASGFFVGKPFTIEDINRVFPNSSNR